MSDLPPTSRPPALHLAGERLWWLATIIVVLALGLPLLHPYWTPQSDSDAYLSVARQIATGRGYQYNGQPITVIPPGWPFVLAGAMRLTGSLLMLKLMLVGLTAASAGLAWQALRRLASPLTASVAIVTAALLPEALAQTTVFHAEALFCLLFWSAILLAMRLNESTGARAGTALSLIGLAMLCAGLVAVRWAAVLTCPVIIAAALRGELLPRRSIRWLAAAVVVLATAGAILPLRLTTAASDTDLPAADSPGHLLYAQGRVNYDTTIAQRIGGAGRWAGGLLWSQDEPVDSFWTVSSVAGWAVLVGLALAAYRGIRRRDWLPAATLLYIGVLIVGWPHTVPRYLVPLAPLVVLGIVQTLLAVPPRLLGRILAGGLVAWIAIHNGRPYAREAALAHADDYYASIDAGRFDDLVDAGHYLLSTRLGPGEVAINRYEPAEDGGAPRTTNRFLRAMILLADVPVRTVPDRWAGEPTSDFFRWAYAEQIRYYLYKPPRLRMRDGQAVRTRHRWILYEVRPTRGVAVELPDVEDWPRRLPFRPVSRRASPRSLAAAHDPQD